MDGKVRWHRDKTKYCREVDVEHPDPKIAKIHANGVPECALTYKLDRELPKIKSFSVCDDFVKPS
jgi:hypothetical protein